MTEYHKGQEVEVYTRTAEGMEWLPAKIIRTTYYTELLSGRIAKFNEANIRPLQEAHRKYHKGQEVEVYTRTAEGMEWLPGTIIQLVYGLNDVWVVGLLGCRIASFNEEDIRPVQEKTTK